MVPSPTPAIVAAIRTILNAQNPLEEGLAGVYEQCEQLAAAEADKVLKRL